MTPTVTAVVAARHRDARWVETVRSILESDHPDFVVCVVGRTDRASLTDPRVRHVERAESGLAALRNAGAGWATSEWVAFTDDDCVVTPTWLTELTAPFALDPRIGIVFGSVKPAPHDPGLGFLPSHARTEPRLARSVRDAPGVGGHGASMAVRRSAWQALRGFDVVLGAAAPLGVVEDTDFVLRALVAGFFAYETPGAAVVHAGFHTWAEEPRVVHDRLLGIAAVLVKNVKRRHWAGVAAAAHLTLKRARGRSHHRVRLRAVIAGIRRGAATLVDPTSGHFMPGLLGGRHGPVPGRRGTGPGPGGREGERIGEPAEAPLLGRGVFGPVIADRSPARLDPSPRASTVDRVSIVMPSWNGRPFLARALAALVAYTTYPYQLVVVDNGSTDGSKELIREFLRAHPDLDATFMDHPDNRYFSTACNDGFRAASPENRYLALYCNDVEATDARWLQELVEAVQPEDTIAAGHAGLDPITDRQRGVFSSYDPVYPDHDVKRRLVELIARPGARYMHLYGYCFLVKRRLLERTGLYLHTGPFTQYHSDWEWYLRWAVMGFEIAPVALKVHHWHSVSELRAFHPNDYDALVRRLDDPAAVRRYLERGRPYYEAESGFRSRYPTATSQALERLRRRFFGP